MLVADMVLLNIFLLVVLFGCMPPGDGPSTQTMESGAAHEASVLEYRRAREERLRRPDGWLSLVGLYWLHEGRNTFGSDPANDVVLPARKAPPAAGSFHVEGSRVQVAVAPGVAVTHDGQPVTTRSLTSDADGDATMLTLGALRFHVIDREGRLGVRIRDRDSEARRNFQGLEYYPIEPNWRVEARYEPYSAPREVEIPNIMGSVYREQSPGRLTVELGGTTYHLDAIPDGPSYLLVFADQTNGSETYGGGRYLTVDLPSEAGPVVLDFNKAYNPPCVFTPYATCPLPPAGHKFSTAVRAGEKGYAGAGHE